MQSIPRPSTTQLPDFCNLGAMLRVLLLVNIMLAAHALVSARPLNGVMFAVLFLNGAAMVEPVLIASLILLCPLKRYLHALPYWMGVAAVVAVELALVAGYRVMLGGAFDASGAQASGFFTDPLWHDWVVAALATLAVLYYFYLRDKAFSPALAEARLQALQTRIRPHFLFNSMTAILSLIRSEPRRAERALEDLADLFRVLLREERRLVPLAHEIGVCKQYLAIESLRLGDRLQIEWTIDEALAQLPIPPLILQPLVENAVHHGIEPRVGPGLIRIRTEALANEARIVITNPRLEGNTQPPGRQGNHMALDNVRERLALNFDVEARLEVQSEGEEYRVTITLPRRGDKA